MTPELAALVARAYHECRRPAPRSLGVCTACCMDPALERRILATPVDELTPEQIREWYGAAFANDIGLAIFLWLMPRILDLLSRDVEVVPWGNEAAFQRCKQTAPVADWPDPWPALMAAFTAAYVDARLDLPQAEFDDTFCMFSHTGLPLGPMLDRLDGAEVPRLAGAILREWSHQPPWFSNAFWDDHTALQQLKDWFARPELAERMLIWGAEHDGPEVDTVLDAGDVLWAGRKM